MAASAAAVAPSRNGGGFRPASSRQPFRPTTRQVPPRKATQSKAQQEEKLPEPLDDSEESEDDAAEDDAENQPPPRMLDAIKEATASPSPSPKKAAPSPSRSPMPLPSSSSPFRMILGARNASPASSPFRQDSSSRPSSSAGTAFSDMETDVEAEDASIVADQNKAFSPSSHTESEDEDDSEDSALNCNRTLRSSSRQAHLVVSSSSSSSPPRVFFGTPSSSEKEQRRRYSTRIRERRLLRRDSLELARRKTLTLEEVEEAARAVRQERKAKEDTEKADEGEDDSVAQKPDEMDASRSEETQGSRAVAEEEPGQQPSTLRSDAPEDEKEAATSPTYGDGEPYTAQAASHEASAQEASISGLSEPQEGNEPEQREPTAVQAASMPQRTELEVEDAALPPPFDETLAFDAVEARATQSEMATIAPQSTTPVFDETLVLSTIEGGGALRADEDESPIMQSVLDDFAAPDAAQNAVQWASEAASTSQTGFDETLALDTMERSAVQEQVASTPQSSEVADELVEVPTSSINRSSRIAPALCSFDETLALDRLEEAAADLTAAAYDANFESGTIVRTISLPCKAFFDETLALETLEESQPEEIEGLGAEVPPSEAEQGASHLSESGSDGTQQEAAAEVSAEEAAAEGAQPKAEVTSKPASESTTPAAEPPANVGTTSASSSFLMDSPGVGLARLGREGTPSRSVLSDIRQQATGSAMRRLFPHIPDNYHEILGKSTPSSTPRSPAVTPLGEKDTNASWNKRAVRLTPTPSKQAPTSQEQNTRPKTPSNTSPTDEEELVRHFSPEMDRLRAARDAILAAAGPSPDKSPKKAMRVVIPSPMKKGGEAESGAVDENKSPVKSPMGTFGRIDNLWQSFKQSGADGVDDHAMPLPSSPIKAPTSPTKAKVISQELTKGPLPTSKELPQPSTSTKPAVSATTRLPKAAPTASTSRLVKPKPVTSGIRPPSSVAPKPQAVVATPSTSSSAASVRKPLSTRLPTQSSARPASADSASSSSSVPATREASISKLKDPRRPPTKPDGTTSVRRAPISALRKLQPTSDGNPFASKVSGGPSDGIDWLASSGYAKAVSNSDNSASGKASPEKVPAVVASPRKPSPTEGSSTHLLSSTSPSRLRINLSPIKLARSGGQGGAARARRVPVGSREATHAPERVAASSASAPASASINSGTASMRSSKSSTGSSGAPPTQCAPPIRPAPHVNLHATTPILQRSANSSRKAGLSASAAGTSSSSSSPEKPTSSSASQRLGTSSSKSSLRGNRDEGPADSEAAADPFAPSSSSERAGETSKSTKQRAPSYSSGTAKSSSSSTSSNPFNGPRASRTKPADSVPSVPISSAALDALTTRNSRKNEAYYAKLDVVVVRIDGPRPPSPSSKIRKSSAGGTRRLGKEQAARARADRAKKRAAGDESCDMSGEGDSLATMSAAKALELGQHRLGAGEQDVYCTPPKVRAGAKGVKWHKALYAGPSEAPREQIAHDDTPDCGGAPQARRGAHRMRGAGPSRLVAREYGLDRHGNVRGAMEAPPSPRWTRVKVTVRKIIYEDDDEESEEEEEEGEEWE
ncbi:hypothetical protein BDZ90DRAFT_3005 [Jaminaea rosea]|uniref:Uncharacterized protein n=1 Tax=Jaminaea rosea TaxID=1569628 RepID=A0A316V3K5_9BASI|nr:hypothetical protein BDZ90DRAFT_3005 [Jaminaea rosea]PWN30025.1 hypothetical protein BDZ90DRAFT_3005 [Jaminaea rosea]